jgi:TrmH family RNA methyltransferase
VITSIHNKRVARAARLKKRAMREKDRLFLVEGSQAVLEALASPGTVRDLFYSATEDAAGPPADRLDEVLKAARKAGVVENAVSDEVMAHLTSTVTPQGLVAVAAFVDVPLPSVLQGSGCVPVLVEVRDPGNAGTILRSADAAAAEAVVFTRSSVDVYNSKTVRATAGSLFHIPVVREVDAVEAIAAFREGGARILAASAEGRTTVYDADLKGPVVVVFGNEARGLPAEVEAMADDTVRVPIAGAAESLNLAAAASVILFESARQRFGSDSIADIVAGAAHDIRSPVTALRGFAGTLLSHWDRLDDSQRRLMLEGLVHDATRMEILVAQLVDAARLRSGSLRLEPVATDLLEAARRLGEELSGWSTWELDVSGEPVVALVDPAKLRSMIMAMVESAQWWGEQGPVLISVSGDAEANLRVWRSGTELDAQGALALFRARVPGSGAGSKIGLFVAKGLAKAHRGRLDADTEGGIGLTLTLPRASSRSSSGRASGSAETTDQ